MDARGGGRDACGRRGIGMNCVDFQPPMADELGLSSLTGCCCCCCCLSDTFGVEALGMYLNAFDTLSSFFVGSSDCVGGGRSSYSDIYKRSKRVKRGEN